MPGYFSLSRQASSNGPAYQADAPHAPSRISQVAGSSPLHSHRNGQSSPAIDDALDQFFDLAVRIVQALPDSGAIQSSYEDKLLLYGLYKQATEGDVRSSRPGFLDVLGRAKWDAWKRQHGVEMDEAKEQYVVQVKRVSACRHRIFVSSGPGADRARACAQMLSEHRDQPLIEEQYQQLANYATRRKAGRNGLSRRDSAASSSSSRSFVSSRQSPLEDEDQLENIAPTAGHTGAANDEAVLLPPLGDLAIDSGSTRAQPALPSAHLPAEGHLKRRSRRPVAGSAIAENAHASDSDSSISLGGDAQSHHASRAGSMVGLRAGERRRRRGEAVKRRRGLEGAAGMTSVHSAAEGPAPRLGQPNHLPLGYRPASTPHLPSVNPQLRAGAPASQQQFYHPGVAPSPVPSLGQFSAPYASPFLTAARLRAGLHASPNPSSIGQGSTMMPMAPQVYPPAPPAPNPSSYSPGAYDVNLPLALEQIQTSLTALHERIIALEHSQALMLAQPADPWTTLLRWFAAIGTGSHRGGGGGQDGGSMDAYAPPGLVQDDHHHSSHKRHRLPLRIILRLLGTLRRTMVDVTFVLVVMSLGVAIWAGVKGRGRGGRRALMQFWASTLRRGRLMYRNAFDRLIEP